MTIDETTVEIRMRWRWAFANGFSYDEAALRKR